MKFSIQLVKFINQHYGSAGDPAPDGVEALLAKIGGQLAAVESAQDFGKRFEGVIIVKLVAFEDIADSDHLRLCKIDDAGKVAHAERDGQGYVQVVCGANNLHEGMLAAWLPPGSTVPSTFGKDPFVLEARELRGHKSNGMLASQRELTLGDDHNGILDIDADYKGVAPGVTFVDAYHLRDDVIIDMENKMFTHRPDCFGWIGLARELEGIQHRPYKSPEWYSLDPKFPEPEGQELKLDVRNELQELVPRFSAMAMSNVKVGPSPVWLQVDLARAGLRSINNVVDYTNFFMLETGQPLHAYDYDKVMAAQGQGDGVKMVIRYPKSGEKIKLLNGKEIEPLPETIMIATDHALLGVGGVMGGADTEVDESTTNIILEAANFDLYSIRRTSMAHGLFTDAVTRFNKGQSPLQTLLALAKIVNEIKKFAGGKVASPLIDDNNVSKEVMDRGSIHPPVTVSTSFVNDRLGLKLTAEEMSQLLINVEFKVAIRHPELVSGSPIEVGETGSRNKFGMTESVRHDEGDVLEVASPFWRTDIEIPEDVVEEVGRLYGYDHLPLDLPKRNMAPAPRDQLLELKSRVRRLLSSAGANEVLSYSFVHGNLLDRVGQKRELAYQLNNALSPDLQYYRLSLTPSLLEKVHSNIKTGHSKFAVYEIGKVHNKGEVDDDGLPRELERIALVFAADDKAAKNAFDGSPYYLARTYLSRLLEALGLGADLTYEPLSKVELGEHPAVQPFDPDRSAAVFMGGRLLGVVGEYRQVVAQAFKLPAYVAGFELVTTELQANGGSLYEHLPRFPKVEQDICLKVAADLPYGELLKFVEDHLAQNRPDQTHHTLSPVDIYQREGDKDHKQITLRLSLASFERTLTDQEVNKLLDEVAAAAKGNLSAERI